MTSASRGIRNCSGDNAGTQHASPGTTPGAARRALAAGGRALLAGALVLLASGLALAATTINEQFAPATIDPGSSSTYTIVLANESTDVLGSAAVTVLLPAGVFIVSPGAIANSCGFTGVSAVVGSSTVSLTGGSIPAFTNGVAGQCNFQVTVSSTVPGNHTASIPANVTPSATVAGFSALTPGSVRVWNTSSAAATLSVNTLQNPTGSKSYSSGTLDDPSTLTLTLSNPNGSTTLPLTSFSDTLPAGMVLAPSPNASVSCTGSGAVNGALAAAAGGSVITLSGGVIGSGGSCSISAKVLVTNSNNGQGITLTNSIPGGAIGNTRGLTSPAFSATRSFNSPISIGKSLTPGTIAAGTPARMTLSIGNASATRPLAITSFSDSLSGTTFKILTKTSSPIAGGVNPTVVCTGTGAVNGTLTAVPDTLNQAFTLTGAKAGPGGACTVTADITSNSDGIHTNTVPANAVVNPDGYSSPSASAYVMTHAQLTVLKDVTVSNVAPGQWTKFTVNISNWAPADVTNVTFKDLLPKSGASQLTLYNPVTVGNPDGSFYTTAGDCSGGSWYGTNAAGTSTGSAPTVADAGILWTGGTIRYGGGVAGVCTINFWAKLPESAAAGMSFDNTLPIGLITGTGPEGAVINTDSDNAVVSYLDKVAVGKGFGPSSIPQGGISTLSLTLYNRTLAPLTGISLTDTLPAGVTLAANPSPTNSCGGTLQAFPSDSQIILSGGGVAKRPDESQESSCVITVQVTGTGLGSYTNTIHPGDFSDTQGLAIPANVTAVLNIGTGLTGTKSFTPTQVDSGGVARVTVTVSNSFNSRQTNISVDDNSFGAGLTVANPANASTNCPGYPTLIVNPGETRARLLGTALNAGVSCDFSFDVAASGAYTSWSNTIPAGKIASAEGLSNTSAIVATLYQTAAQLSINKSFSPVLIAGGAPSVLQFDIANTSLNLIAHKAGFTDMLPEGMEVYAAPNASTTCIGGTVAAIAGDNKIILSGATLAAGSSCKVYVTTTSSKFLNLTNTIPAGSALSQEGYTNPAAASATLSTLQGVEIMKRFSPQYIIPGGVSRLHLQLINTFDPYAPTPMTLTGAAVSDALPSGVLVAPTPNAGTTCAGGTVTASPGGSSVALSGATLPTGTTCLVSVDVVAASLGSYDNFVPVGSLSNDQLITNHTSAHALLYVVAKPTLSKSFGSATRNPGGSNRLTVTVSNGSSVQLTGMALTDTLPAGLAIASSPGASGSCTNGIVSASPGGTSLALTGATLPAGGSCSFSADVVGGSPGSYINSIDAGRLVTDQGLSNEGSVTASMTVNNAPFVTKAFSPVSITSGGTSTLTITLGNPDAVNAITLSAAFVDALPGHVTVAATPNITKSCPGAVTAAAGSSTVSYPAGATIPAAGCSISVDVTSSTAGTHTNTVAGGQLSTGAGTNPDPAYASLAVGAGALVPPTNAASFERSPIFVGETSRLTITLGNPNSSGLTLSSTFTDALPGGVSIASTPNLVVSCPGTAVAAAGSTTVSYPAGAVIPAGGCSISVNVTSGSAGSYTNTLAAGALATDGGSTLQPATAGLVVQTLVPPTLTKSFSPSTINPGGVSTLTLALGNANSAAQTLSAVLTDTLPGNVLVAAVPNIRGTCIVTNPGSVTAAAGSGSLSYASGSAVPSGGCTVIVDVTSSVSGGPYTNSIPAGGLKTVDAGNSTAAASAVLFVNPPQPPSISKSFSPASIVSGTTATLTLSFGNGNLAPTALTADLVDALPGNLTVAAAPNIRVGGACTLGKVAAAPYGTTVAYQSGGAIPAGGCSVSVDVTSSHGAIYSNSIPTGALVTGYGSNAVGTSADLKVMEPPTLAKAFSSALVEKGSYTTLTLTLGNPNSYPIHLTSALTDALPANLLVASPPSVGGSCAGAVTAVAGSGSISYASGAAVPSGGCTVTVRVTSSVIGPYTNSIAASALATDVGTNASGTTADLTVYERIAVGKAFSPAEINTGGSSTLTITLYNTNALATTLTSSMTDTLPAGLVVKNPANIGGSCTGGVTATPGTRTVSYAQGASIPHGSCTITADVTSANGAIYTNTIYAGTLQTGYGSNAALATADLKVKQPPTLAKAFAPAAVAPDENSVLTLTLGNPNANFAITTSAPLVDTLPAGLVASATPGIVTSCPGAVTATAGAGTVSYASGSSIPAGGCTISVNVRSATLGAYTNSIAVAALATDTGSSPAKAEASLSVRYLPTLVKAFAPATLNLNATGTSRLTLSLGNRNLVPLSLTAALVDVLPAGMTVASSSGLTTTCPGTVTAAAGSGTVSYPVSASIPVGGCSISLDVSVATSRGTMFSNTVAAGGLQTDRGANAALATASLKVLAPPTLTKAFAPTSLRLVNGGNATLTLNLGNPNTYPIALTADLVDTFPSGLVLGTPASIGGTCAASYVRATAGGMTVKFVNGAVIPSGGCTITVPVTAAVGAAPGNYLNDMSGYEFTTDTGHSDRATAVLTLMPVADLAVAKTVDPASTTFGANVTFRVTVTNNGPSPTTNVTLRDTLPLGYTFVSATPSTGTTYQRNVNYDTSSLLIWTVGTLANGAAATFDVVAKVRTFGPFANTASVYASDAYDPVSANNSATAAPALPLILDCDVNRDQRIDKDDIDLIFAAAGLLTGSRPLDPRDLDGDGLITVNDARGCVLRCDNATCVKLLRGTQGVLYTAPLSASGGPVWYGFALTGGLLPAGLTLDPGTGVLSGTPTASGTFTFSVTATDALHGITSVGVYTLYLDPPLVITTASLPGAALGATYSQTVVATGGQTAKADSSPLPYSWSVSSGALPGGMTLDAATGTISGAPTTTGSATFTVKVQDYNGRSTTKALSITSL